MSTRIQNAIEHAGKLDRAEQEIKTAHKAAERAYCTLIETDTEVCALLAIVMMNLDKALKKLKG